MITFSNLEVTGWEHAFRGMRNPLNSWDKSDSKTMPTYWLTMEEDDSEDGVSDYIGDFAGYHLNPDDIGIEDLNLAERLASAGSTHSKFRRMITVYMDITAPLYWWKEFDTYKVGTVANSCSTMHTIHKKPFERSDFSLDHVDENSWGDSIVDNIISYLNDFRDKFLETHDKKYWWEIIQLMPASYNQKRTVMLNYEVLANIYSTRKGHKLDEWNNFCTLIETLPWAANLICAPLTEEENDLQTKFKHCADRALRDILGMNNTSENERSET